MESEPLVKYRRYASRFVSLELTGGFSIWEGVGGESLLKMSRLFY
jgi:hypothetical protein